MTACSVFLKFVVMEMNFACLCLSIWHVMLFLAYCVIFCIHTVQGNCPSPEHGKVPCLSVWRKSARDKLYRETCRDIAKEKGHRHVVEYLDRDVPTLKSKVSTTE